MNARRGQGRKGGKRALIGAVAALVSLGPAAGARAQDGWLRDGSTAGKPPNTAVSGDFAVLQIATDEPDKLMSDWDKPTPGVSLTTTSQTVRNRPVVTFIIFKGCRADSAGNCNVTVDYNTRGPNGKTYDETKGAEVWVGKPPAPDLGLQLSVSGYGLRIENKDPLGDYQIRATITDHVAGITLSTEQKLTVAAN